MPRILNPNYKYTTQTRIDRLTAYFAANVGTRSITFDQVRAAHADLATLTDAQIAQLAQDAGFRVEP